MNLLFIAHRIPYPPNKGDKIRSFNELRYLAGLGRVTLAALVDDPRDFQYRKKLEDLCDRVLLAPIAPRRKKIVSLSAPFSGRPMSVHYFYDSGLQRQIDQLLETEEFDGIFCFSATSAEYVFRSRALNRDSARCPLLVMDFCDVDSRKWHDYSTSVRGPLAWLYRLEGRLLENYESRVIASFAHVILISEREIALFRQVHPTAREVVEIGNGVDLDFFNPAAFPRPEKAGNEVVFTGAMDYYVNIEGVLWFVDEIWPGIRKACPEACFTIVGSNPAPEIVALGERSEGITVTGYVDDIRTYYARATVCVAPLRIARGIQNKVLEALAMGRAVVATANAFEGIRAEPDRDLVVRDRADDFAAAVIELLENPEKRRRLEASGRCRMEENYRWETNLERLGELFRAGSETCAEEGKLL
jgi:sugar transferase (PEP-CTERM/EpsH1 system associated)